MQFEWSLSGVGVELEWSLSVGQTSLEPHSHEVEINNLANVWVQ